MIRIIGSAHPKYLAATDVLIGDMSNINYEFLLFNRPVVLLANEWVKRNFPDIGIKTTLENLKSGIMRSLQNKAEYESNRKLWRNRTMSMGTDKASSRIIDAIMEGSNISRPEMFFVHGGNPVRKTNLSPLMDEAARRGIAFSVIKRRKEMAFKDEKNVVIIAAHYCDLWHSCPGFKVHIDHDLKGIGTANLKYAVWEYKKNGYFPHIDMHIVAGEAGEKRTKLVLGPLADRTCVVGYPKADDLLRFDTAENKKEIYKELGLKDELPLVTYAPAGARSTMKPGGSLSKEVLGQLNAISGDAGFHILVKKKYKYTLKQMFTQPVKDSFNRISGLCDDGEAWRMLSSSPWTYHP